MAIIGVSDMVLWHEDPAVLKNANGEIQNYVENRLLCRLKPVQINQVRSGLPFLGYHLFPYDTQLLQQSKQRFIRKLKYADEQLENNNWNETTYQRHVLPLIAFTGHANAKSLRSKIIGQSP